MVENGEVPSVSDQSLAAIPSDQPVRVSQSLSVSDQSLAAIPSTNLGRRLSH